MIRFLCLILILFFLNPLCSDAEEVQRVLLVGTDKLGIFNNDSADESMSRADVILILAVKPGMPEIRVVNLERDYLVELPDGIGSNKLATATYFGGPELLIHAVNELFGLDLRSYIQTDIGSISTIIDEVGGVDVNVFEDDIVSFRTTYFIDPILSPGINHFNGIQAQNFIRFRDENIDAVESNKQRNERQMRVFSSIIDKFFLLSLRDAANTITGISSLVQTNLSLYDLLLFVQAFSQPGELVDRLVFMNSPTGAYVTRRVRMHQVVEAENIQEELRAVQNFLWYPSR